ncbi:MAG TPA: hypothetical protein VMB50_04755 [Myxococcales bacterium]|nr:hypothetical protein [Myxococcales bacterium]
MAARPTAGSELWDQMSWANLGDGQRYSKLNALPIPTHCERKECLDAGSVRVTAVEFDDRDVTTVDLERLMEPLLDRANLLSLMWVRRAR